MPHLPGDPAMNDQQLKRWFASLAERPSAAVDCPAPETLWEAATTPPRDPVANGILLDHVAGCATCALAWRLARDLESRGITADGSARPAPSAGPRWLLPAAAVIIALAGASILWMPAPDFLPAAWRAASSPAIRSLLPERATQPRAALTLRWGMEAPEGTRFQVRLLDAELKLLHQSAGQPATEHQVPGAVLEGLPPGAKLHWQVEAILPDGRRVLSPTFILLIE